MSGTLILTAVLMGLATAAARFLPFLAGARLAGPALRRLFAELFPPAVLAVLLVYMARGLGDADAPAQMAQAAGAAVTVAAHLGWRNLLLSVGSGTAACMLVLHLAG
ncbi:AzlD domain-containing protein [Azospirillum halopraeferens]|uniref:AzlD domain-containing protein n=1 Tax=Azospirillum halopraeferens TaxID=34010 RepID=UPI00042285E3|nr:AzlD domain-containing protein [Azospirillum halopraeferens]